MRQIVFYGAGENAYKNFAMWYEGGLKPVCFVDAEIGKQGAFFEVRHPVDVKLEILSLFEAIEKYPDCLLYLTQHKMHLPKITTYLLELGIPYSRIRYCDGFQEPSYCTLLDQNFIHIESYPPNSSLFTHCTSNNALRVNFSSTGGFENDYKKLFEYTTELKAMLKAGYYTRCGDCARKRGIEYIGDIKYSFEIASGIQGCDVCNFKCVFCGFSDVGAVVRPNTDIKEAASDGRYDFKKILHHIETHYNPCDVFFTFGAGEISISELKNDLLETWNRTKWRGYIATNASYFLPELALLLEQKSIIVCTSLDSGTSATFMKIKQVDAFHDVVNNLKKYSETGGHLWVKYILLESVNDSMYEMDAFLDLVFELYRNNPNVMIVLSRDFRVNHADSSPHEVSSFRYMYKSAEARGVKCHLKTDTFTHSDINIILENKPIQKLSFELARPNSDVGSEIDCKLSIGNVTPEFVSAVKLPDKKGKKLVACIISPPIPSEYMHQFPLGLSMVSSAIKASGRDVHILKPETCSELERWLPEYLLHKKIDVVMTGGFSYLFPQINRILKLVKSASSNITTIVGGGVVSGDPENAMKALCNADYGVIGEGEITINALMYALETNSDPSVISGVVFKKNDEWIINGDYPVITNLDMLPYPDYDGFGLGMIIEKHSDKMNVLPLPTSRSCPFLCTFCFHTCGNKYRQMSLDYVFRQIDWIVSRYPIKYIDFQNEVFLAKQEYVIEFCNRIKSYGLQWMANTRADMISEEVIQAMVGAGCVFVFIGVESASNIILKSMKKGVRIEQIENAFDMCKKYGLFANGTLIFGDPEETWDTAVKSLNWLRQRIKWSEYYQLNNLSANLIWAYPGTKLYLDAVKLNIIKDPVKHAKSGGMAHVNLSKLNDNEYNALPHIIELIQKPNKLTNARMLPCANNDNTVTINGKCPHCNSEVSCDGYALLFNCYQNDCPRCGNVYNVLPIESADVLNITACINNLKKNGNIGVWGINVGNFYWLLELMPCFYSDDVFFINKDDSVQSLGGKIIHHPDVVNEESIEIIIVPNSPTVYSAIKKQISDEYKKVKKVIHITKMIM